MAVLGIESSAHTFGVGVVENGKILSNKKIMFPISDKGLIPSKVADFHAINANKVIKEAIEEASVDIDSVGYTKGPGIGSCLNVGQLAAKTISSKYNLDIFPVNHALAHIEIARRINKFSDPLVLYVSGGNSQILSMVEKPFKHYHVFGETFDIGVGNMLDTFARAAKLNPAWGSCVAKAAIGGAYINMPYTVKGMDFTFTGLLTNAITLIGSEPMKNIAYSLQETAFAMLCEATERALMLTKKRELIICGGAAQSSRLKEMLIAISKEHSIKFRPIPDEYNADNGAMVALVAEEMKNGRRYSIEECGINQRYRVDSIKITW